MRNLWGGFVDDKLDTRQIDTGFGGWNQRKVFAPMIFASRSEARKEYQDVRRVEVSFEHKKRPVRSR